MSFWGSNWGFWGCLFEKGKRKMIFFWFWASPSFLGPTRRPTHLLPRALAPRARSADHGSMCSPRGTRSPSPVYGWRPCGPCTPPRSPSPAPPAHSASPRLILSHLDHGLLASVSSSASSATVPSPRQPDLATMAPPSNPARTRLPHPLTYLAEPFEAHFGKIRGQIGHLPPC
jgi:hypothetical protein